MSIYMNRQTINDGHGHIMQRTFIRRTGDDCQSVFGGGNRMHGMYGGHRMCGGHGGHRMHGGFFSNYSGFRSFAGMPPWQEPQQFPGLSNSNFFVKAFSIGNAIGGAFRGLFGR